MLISITDTVIVQLSYNMISVTVQLGKVDTLDLHIAEGR